jgi:hypothetical protein
MAIENQGAKIGLYDFKIIFKKFGPLPDFGSKR